MCLLINNVKAIEVFDSRGNPTVECELTTDKGGFRAIVPSGASTGVHEAIELRDGGARFHGKGVLTAIKNVNNVLAPLVTGKVPKQSLDAQLLAADGSNNKGKLGANAILSVSMAISRAAAAEKGVPLYTYLSELSGRKPALPKPASNIINGGAHAGNELNIQEYMIIPTNAKSFREGARMVSETYHQLKEILKKKYGPGATNVGDEGGFAPQLKDDRKPFDLIMKAINELGYSSELALGIDAAASNFYKNGVYSLDKGYSGPELADYYLDLAKTYKFELMEDPFAEDDFDSFALLNSKSKFKVVGDDLTVTNPKRIRTAIEKKACDCLLVKVNQIGSITETLEAVKLARDAGWATMVSHRSGETEDAFLSDFAVGIGSEYIKLGAPCRGERTAKYNQLLRLEEELKS